MCREVAPWTGTEIQIALGSTRLNVERFVARCTSRQKWVDGGLNETSWELAVAAKRLAAIRFVTVTTSTSGTVTDVPDFLRMVCNVMVKYDWDTSMYCFTIYLYFCVMGSCCPIVATSFQVSEATRN